MSYSSPKSNEHQVEKEVTDRKQKLLSRDNSPPQAKTTTSLTVQQSNQLNPSQPDSVTKVQPSSA